MSREIPIPSDSPEESTDNDAEMTRRESLSAGGFVLGAALFGGDWLSFFGDDAEPNQLTDSGEAVIDLDDITGVDIRNGLSVDKDAGTISIDAQEVEDALLTVLDSGASQSTTVEEIDFTDSISVSGSGSTVQVSATAAQELARILDSGVETATNVTELDFTDGLSVTSTTDGAQVSASGGGLTTVDSGSTTVTSGSDTTVSLTASRDSNLMLSAYPESDWGVTSGDNTDRMIVGGSTPSGGGSTDLFARLQYNTAVGEWQVFLWNDAGEDVAINWTVYSP